MTSGVTERDRAKADRQAAILHEAARLFAERGFSGVSLEELGAAVGVSGPAVYRHFANKQALLGAILVRVSERLLNGGQQVDRRAGGTPRPIELEGHHRVPRRLRPDRRGRHPGAGSRPGEPQRGRPPHGCDGSSASTSNCGSAILAEIHPTRGESELRVRAHACFGLINSTPHSVRRAAGAPAGQHRARHPGVDGLVRADRLTPFAVPYAGRTMPTDAPGGGADRAERDDPASNAR